MQVIEVLPSRSSFVDLNFDVLSVQMSVTMLT